MKIASWNICADNKFQVENIIYIISTHNPDIICLQEITLESIKKIKNLDYFANFSISYCLDFEKKIKLKNGDFEKKYYYLAILSKHTHNHHFTDHVHEKPLKISLATKHFGIEKPRQFQFIDLNYKNVKNDIFKIRVFNLHLEVAGGSNRRLQEFKKALSQFNKESVNIYCGDLNIFTRFWLNFLVGWGFSYTLKDYFVNERASFNRLFKKFGLVNHFKRNATFPKFRLQLDHILTPNYITINQKIISKKVFDSDHKFIILKLDLDNLSSEKLSFYNGKVRLSRIKSSILKLPMSLKSKLKPILRKR
jgi:endonuclease/exonuclease/phosphatase family metal-dependent hydrolase